MRLKVTGKKIVHFAIILVFIAIVGAGWKLTARTSYESADYNVVESDGSFEVRDYPDLMLVTTPMSSQGSDSSFGRLFRYISGANDVQRNVAMTTPVFMEPEGQRLDGQMGFVVPKKVSVEGIPDPVDETVRIRQRDGGRFAAIRFAGRMDASAVLERERQLRSWIVGKGFSGSDAIEFAGYDPPWTPNPFRRNEILIRLH